MNEKILQKHLRLYPLSSPTDAVKLAYQSAFGCGHLLADATACLRMLQSERTSLPADPGLSAATMIGGGLCRLNLAAPEMRALSSARILGMMKLTEKRVIARAGNEEAFCGSLSLLRELARKGETPFPPDALGEYLAAYEAQGCPPVSHSEGYRAAYHPAYRVVLSDFAVLLPLIALLDARLAETGAMAGAGCGGVRGADAHSFRQAVVAVLDGSCGAGKTTLTALLGELYAAPVVHMDDFFLPFELRTTERLGQAGGNIHYERFSDEVLPRLSPPQAFCYRRYDCATGEYLMRECPTAPLRIVEGSYALHPRFRAAYRRMGALTAFISVEPEEQLDRLRRRSPDRYGRFVAEWIPMENAYFQGCEVPQAAKITLHSVPWND